MEEMFETESFEECCGAYCSEAGCCVDDDIPEDQKSKSKRNPLEISIDKDEE